MSILLVAGIPFDGSFWKAVQHRLVQHNCESTTWTLCRETGSLGEQIQDLKKVLLEKNIDTVIAHGLSIPVALEACHIVGNRTLIISNGLLTPNVGLIRWILPRLQQMPCTITRQVLRPSISLPILSSSAAFRRLVINPYVMDRNTLADLTEAVLSSPSYRKNVGSYISSLGTWKFRTPKDTTVFAIWGDHDLLFPIEQIEACKQQLQISRQHIHRIEGGAHFHPIERPWSIADAIQTILCDSP